MLAFFVSLFAVFWRPPSVLDFGVFSPVYWMGWWNYAYAHHYVAPVVLLVANSATMQLTSVCLPLHHSAAPLIWLELMDMLDRP